MDGSEPHRDARDHRRDAPEVRELRRLFQLEAARSRPPIRIEEPNDLLPQNELRGHGIAIVPTVHLLSIPMQEDLDLVLRGTYVVSVGWVE